jgi:hypothetical protein
MATDTRSSLRSRASEDPYGGVDETSPPRSTGRRRPSEDIQGGDRRNPSRDLSGSQYGADRRRLERSRSPGRDMISEAGSGASGAAASATRDEVVPVKSTIAEEEVALPPFARRDSIAEDDEPTTPDRREDNDEDHRSMYEEELEEDALSPRTPVGLGLNAISQRFGSEPQERSPDERRRPNVDVGSKGLGQIQATRDADLLTKVEESERHVEGGAAATTQAEERVRQLNAELSALRQVRQLVCPAMQDTYSFVQRAEEQGDTILALRRELEEAQTAKELAQRDLNEEREEIESLRVRCDALEQERLLRQDMGDAQGSADPATLERVQQDMQALITELTELSIRNDELIQAREDDMATIRSLGTRADDFRKKYERAKTELRSMKGSGPFSCALTRCSWTSAVTSQLFAHSVPRSGDADRLPVSVDGLIADVHITAFLSAVDDLLNAGRSPAPTAVLAPTKAVVNALHIIIDDVRSTPATSSADVTAMLARADATVENLVAAAKTHATSAGMSPVSLLDAAASHVSAAVTELGKTVLIRRARAGEGPAVGASTFDPSLDPVAESSLRTTNARPISEQGSSNASSSPPPIFDRTAAPGSDATTTDEGDDAWTELKVSTAFNRRCSSR